MRTAHAASNVKTLTLIDPRGGRQVVWSLEEAFQSVSADQFREQFR